MPLPRRRDREIEKDPSACIISDETFSKAEPYGIMPRREAAAPFKAIADRVSVDYTEARRSRRSTGSGSKIQVPPNHLNFNTPMSSALRNALAHILRQPGSSEPRLLANVPGATFRE